MYKEKPRNPARRREFETRQARMRLIQLRTMVVELRQQCAKLDNEIETAERESGVFDPSNFAYSLYAKDVRARKARIEQSIEALETEAGKISGLLNDRPLAA